LAPPRVAPPGGGRRRPPPLRGPVAQVLHREADRVADRGLLAGEADLALVEELGHRREVRGERRLEEGARPEEHEPDAVALALEREALRHRAHRAEAIDRLAVDLEVRR